MTMTRRDPMDRAVDALRKFLPILCAEPCEPGPAEVGRALTALSNREAADLFRLPLSTVFRLRRRFSASSSTGLRSSAGSRRPTRAASSRPRTSKT